MAIEAYVGLPGHGKSYGVVEHVVLPSIMEGRHVVTNIPLEVDEIIADYGTTGSQITQLPEDWFERADLADFIPNGSVLILDELWRRWPSGLKANQASLPDKSLLAEHRHRVDASGRSMRVVLVTQDLSQLAAWVRILVEQTYKMTKLTAIGATKKYRVDIYLGAPTGQNIPKSKLIRQTFGQYKKDIYRYYSSATQSATGTVGDESKADKRGTVWRSPFMIFCIVAPIIGIPFLLWQAVGIFSSGFGANVEPESPSEPVALVETSGLTNPLPAGFQVEQINPSPQAQQVPPELPDSSVWRVAGYIKRGAAGTTGSTGWQSITGYGQLDSEPVKQAAVPDLVVLYSAVYGVRHVLASDCDLYPDGINWHCIIDGTRVAPWTGRGDSTQWAGDSQRLVGRTAAVASGATESSSTTNTLVNPQPL